MKSIALTVVITLVVLGSAVAQTAGLATLSAGFKGPAQDAFDGLERFYKTSEVVELDTQKLLAIAKRKISTKADQHVYDLLNARYSAQSGENIFEDAADKIGSAVQDSDPSKCNHDLDCLQNMVDAAKINLAAHSKMNKVVLAYLNARAQCVAETSVIFDPSVKDAQKEKAAKGTCLSLLESAKDASEAMIKQ